MCHPSWLVVQPSCSFVFFFNDTATTEIYTLSLHDALPISAVGRRQHGTVDVALVDVHVVVVQLVRPRDRKSTRLNSSHSQISYAVFCLKKKMSLRILAILLRHAVCARELIFHGRIRVSTRS